MIEEYLHSKYGRLQVGLPDIIRIVLNMHNVVLFLGGGGLIYSSAVRWAASNVQWARGLIQIQYIPPALFLLLLGLCYWVPIPVTKLFIVGIHPTFTQEIKKEQLCFICLASWTTELKQWLGY